MPADLFAEPHEEPLVCYQTFLRRFWAGILDGFVLIPINALTAFLTAPHRPMMAFIVGSLFGYCAVWLYSILMHARYGQTLGKMAAGVVVMDVAEGRYPTLWQAFLRDIGDVVLNLGGLGLTLYAVASGLDAASEQRLAGTVGVVLAGGGLTWFGLEILTMLTNRKRRALHDFIAGTVVVRC